MTQLNLAWLRSSQRWIRSIFDEKDVDSSSEIDRNELASAIQSLWVSIGNPLSASELDTEVASRANSTDHLLADKNAMLGCRVLEKVGQRQ